MNPSSPTDRAYIGSYQVQRTVGEGAFGTVYAAYQPFLDRKVAIKVLHTDQMANATSEQSFMNEARTIARMRHPNIVTVYEFGVLPAEPQTLPYMVMEYLPGETLQTRLARERLPIVEVVRIVEQLAEGLDYAHARNVIHRDLKPANILFSEQNQPVIVDYGLAKLLELGRPLPVSSDQSTSTGTPAYMSPEQVMGEPTSAFSDQYSLALITYEMLTNKVPFVSEDSAGDFVKQLTARVEGPPPSVRTHQPELPTALDAVFARALAVLPAARFPTARDFAREFGDALLPDRKRAYVKIVSDPVQAALLQASRRTILTGLWGLVGVCLMLALYCTSLFLRSYAVSASSFVSDGVIVAETGQAGQHMVTGFWPGSTAEQVGVKIGDLTDFNLNDDYAKADATIKINGLPRSQVSPDWQPKITDTIEHTFSRDGQPYTVTYGLYRSNFKLVILALALIPIVAGFLSISLLLLRWGAEPGLQVYTLTTCAGLLALIGIPLLDVANGLTTFALLVLFPAYVHFILLFPEPATLLERYPRRVWWLYAPILLGIAQFLLGADFTIYGFDFNLLLYMAYATLLTVAFIAKWVRRDARRYPGLWGIIAVMLASNIAAVAASILFGLHADTVLATFGNGINRWIAAYSSIFVTILVGVVLSTIGYHSVQRQLGYSLITAVSQRGSQN
jgi:serine/threonine protein kinase